MKINKLFGSLFLAGAILSSCAPALKEVSYWDARSTLTPSYQSPYNTVKITGTFSTETEGEKETIKIDSTFKIKGEKVIDGYRSFVKSDVAAASVFGVTIANLNSVYSAQKITPKYYIGTGDVSVVSKIDVRQWGLLSGTATYVINELKGVYEYNNYGLLLSADEYQETTQNDVKTITSVKASLKYSTIL